MTAATALCTPNNIFYQRVLSLNRSSLPVALRQNNSSVICTSKSTTIVCRSSEFQLESDENNNSRTVKNLIEEVLLITSDEEEEDDKELLNDKISHEQEEQINRKPISNEIDEELFLSFVGLRMKTKKLEKSHPTMKTLTKRWATPLCLLPLPKHNERVRQALYSLLPFLKFLRITNDIERFCATDGSIRNRNSSSPLSSVRSRKSKSLLMRTENKRRTNGSTSMKNTKERRSNIDKQNNLDQFAHSILDCRVSLDRLEQSTIEQIMKSAMQESSNETPDIMEIDNELPPPINQLKRKADTDQPAPAKRLKSKAQDQSIAADQDNDSAFDSSLYKRLYLKCFACSKRQYIDGNLTNSNILHSHWLEHGEDLTINIYDSEIDSILTRVIEFFRSPRRHTLEGKLKNVFVLNSAEVHRLSSNDPSTSDTLIVID